jgi:hypothetical protein
MIIGAEVLQGTWKSSIEHNAAWPEAYVVKATSVGLWCVMGGLTEVARPTL